MTWTLPSRFPTLAALAALGGLTLVLPSPASPQDRPLVTPDDYGRWERLGGVELSPFGEWIAYVVTRVDEKSELRVRKLEEDSRPDLPMGLSAAVLPRRPLAELDHWSAAGGTGAACGERQTDP